MNSKLNCTIVVDFVLMKVRSGELSIEGLFCCNTEMLNIN